MRGSHLDPWAAARTAPSQPPHRGGPRPTWWDDAVNKNVPAEMRLEDVVSNLYRRTTMACDHGILYVVSNLYVVIGYPIIFIEGV